MSIEAQKLELISKIAVLQNETLISELSEFLRKYGILMKNNKNQRQAGWGKDLFTNVADDFDDVIPSGFEEYVLTPDQLKKR